MERSENEIVAAPPFSTVQVKPPRFFARMLSNRWESPASRSVPFVQSVSTTFPLRSKNLSRSHSSGHLWSWCFSRSLRYRDSFGSSALSSQTKCVSPGFKAKKSVKLKINVRIIGRNKNIVSNTSAGPKNAIPIMDSVLFFIISSHNALILR